MGWDGHLGQRWATRCCYKTPAPLVLSWPLDISPQRFQPHPLCRSTMSSQIKDKSDHATSISNYDDAYPSVELYNNGAGEEAELEAKFG